MQSSSPAAGTVALAIPHRCRIPATPGPQLESYTGSVAILRPHFF